MLLQEGQKVPFDISDFGIIFYKDSIGLEQRIKKSIEDYLDKLDDSTCDSPVISSLNGRACSTASHLKESLPFLFSYDVWERQGFKKRAGANIFTISLSNPKYLIACYRLSLQRHTNSQISAHYYAEFHWFHISDEKAALDICY